MLTTVTKLGKNFMPVIPSVFGSLIGQFTSFAYWAVKLHNDKWLCELDRHITTKDGLKIRQLDWTLDMTTTSDVLHIKELWMFCPKTWRNPMGSTATLRFAKEESGTAFYFKQTVMSHERRLDNMIIGKVWDKDSGDCEVFIWDDALRVMTVPMQNNVNDFQPWRDGLAPIGRLSHEVIGLKGVSE